MHACPQWAGSLKRLVWVLWVYVRMKWRIQREGFGLQPPQPRVSPYCMHQSFKYGKVAFGGQVQPIAEKQGLPPCYPLELSPQVHNRQVLLNAQFAHCCCVLARGLICPFRIFCHDVVLLIQVLQAGLFVHRWWCQQDDRRLSVLFSEKGDNAQYVIFELADRHMLPCTRPIWQRSVVCTEKNSDSPRSRPGFRKSSLEESKSPPCIVPVISPVHYISSSLKTVCNTGSPTTRTKASLC
mmetsp:Transcript_33278/g.78920  ORF Transcript_33278/g.78920 Transcript_33278/m.78920 type:complete len:239 (-) Transcript_33278:82-798(-)